MKQLKISAKHRKRTGTTKCGQLRKEGFVPAVIYGKSGSESIKVDSKELIKLMRAAAGSATLVEISVDNGSKKLALIQTVDRHPLKDFIRHVDFHEVSPHEKMHAMIPVHVHGEAKGILSGGIVEILMHTLDIHCLPADLPESFDLDVSSLNIGEAIHIKDIPALNGISIHADPEAVVITCLAPKLQAEETEATPEAPAAKEEAPKS